MILNDIFMLPSSRPDLEVCTKFGTRQECLRDLSEVAGLVVSVVSDAACAAWVSDGHWP